MLLLAVTLGATVMWAPSAQAAPTNPSVSPSSVAESASPAMTFTWSVTSPTSGRVIGVLLQGFSIAGSGLPTATLATGTGTPTATCTFSGAVVTWRSAGFTGGDGATSQCDLGLWFGEPYVELKLDSGIGLNPGAVVTLDVPAGVLQAPATPGTYTVREYLYDHPTYVDDGFTSITVGPVAPSTTTIAEPRPWIVQRQAVPMPASGHCADVVDEHLRWGTAAKGGWQRGWEPWAGPPGSDGGWACIRALVNRTGHLWSVDDTAL